jgi:hypothetical protein
MAAIVAAVTVCGVSASAHASTVAPRGLTIYTVATNVQFINSADDRARGAANNPFDPATNKLRPRVSSTGDGPFAGDVVVFNFDLYQRVPPRKSIGSASYTCFFNYTRHALCQAYYQLPRGTLTAAGPVDFNTETFKLVVTGGTKLYLAARGQMSSVQSRSNAQRVSFQLLR